MGIICGADGVGCDADGPARAGCVVGAAIGTRGLKCSICVTSVRFWNASSCLGLRFGILIFNARSTLPEVEIQDRPEKTMLTKQC